MVSQERAERTRQRLLHAAAEEFSLHGYGGTSLQRISAAAGGTMGALTFHFPTKLALARAVYCCGSALTRDAVARAVSPVGHADASRLHRVIGITQALARLLREEAAVRAASRLCRDRVLGQDHWHDAWMPDVRRLAEQAHCEGELRPGTPPDTVVLLTRFLVLGMTELAQADSEPGPHGRDLEEVWQVLLHGVAAGGSSRW
ncbi:DNA-binding transcriptional regulator, AcrR family [Streptomyces indicus]|uniref:DNA-binding transcriptional regulator, AcrR family n=2 Tax=Streptomyces indicus TaxID=417292 RepID=A0A1G9HMX8_9ACTN|nr:DNA-binding transcriptional regulator, AcrR family [Streptomyces indicus]